MDDVQSIDLQQERPISAIFAATLKLYRLYPLLFALLALAVMAPFDLAVLALAGYGPLRDGHESFAVVWLLILLRGSLITPLISALHMHAVLAIGEGRKPRLGAVARQGLSALPVVVAAAIMANIGIFLGFLALVVPGIVLSLRWAVVAQVAALEQEGWLESLRSSRRLTATHYLHIFGLALATSVIAFAVTQGARAAPLGDSSGAGSVAVGIAVDSVIASLAALTLAILYFDLKARHSASAERASAPREHPHLRDLD